jgi:hypothetical protein
VWLCCTKRPVTENHMVIIYAASNLCSELVILLALLKVKNGIFHPLYLIYVLQLLEGVTPKMCG